ncbi:VOC family protein [Emcibacter nanhaiensis]|uniref:VOC family protein n=1 Tax=Emcibacter nanhaiensis TaxID=1505037 RepID=A0A501PJK6_9PROT|nr:VOC family protein [Emcibacter nanhaiensis]TPD60228.1 VOC family protein [Emcibacter nanhaiensis]
MLPGYCHVDHVSITVADLDKAVDFYCKIFGAEVAYRMGPFDAEEIPEMEDSRDWTEAHVDVKDARLSLCMLKLASNLMIELFEYERGEDQKSTPPRNCDIGGHHLAFKVENIEKAVEYLEENGCAAMAGPIVMEEGPTVGARAQYLRDPFGNYMELMEYDRQGFMAETGITPYGTAAND